MENRIDIIEDQIAKILYRLDFHDQTNETQLESFNEMIKAINSSKEIDKNILERFELMELRLKNKDSEIEILNTQIRTLNTLIETLNLKLDHLIK
ncbi:MAG: hypothetical protein R2773_07520 [Flavobacteriaceae bacterium]